MPFTLAVDARDLARDHRGLGRYARAVVREFTALPELSLVLVVDTIFAATRRKELATAIGSEAFRVTSAIPKQADAAWHPWNGIFIRGKSVRHVLTIADVAPFRFPALDQTRRAHEQAPFLQGVAKAERILTTSEASKRDIIELLGARPEAVVVTYPGVDETFRPGPPGTLPPQLRCGQYLLFIGDPQEPRKNFQMLYDAYLRAFSGLDGGPLLAVLCTTDPKLPGVAHVSIAGDAELRALYRGALATCVPSLYEGFGLPVAESMACGTPVLAARASSLPEVAGDAAILLDPLSVEAWIDAMQRIAAGEHVRAELRELGIRQASKFDWKRCARQTLTAIRGTPLQEHATATVVRSSVS